MLLINVNMNPYWGSPKKLSRFTLSDLEFQSQDHSDYETYLVKEQLHWTLKMTLVCRGQGHSDFEALHVYVVKEQN